VQERLIDGPVKKVDPIAKTVQVGWFFGLLSTTLEVTDGTEIAVEGAKASLQDVREGDEVKASYETRDGKYIAKSIEATRSEATGGAGRTKRGPGSSTSSQMMEPKESSTPPSGGAKTP
jgi:Cu/Ag efflux protein CusF